MYAPTLHCPLALQALTLSLAITIVALPDHKSALEKYIKEKFPTTSAGTGLRKSETPITLEFPSQQSETLGTADLIRILYKKGSITDDFIVLPCDLVVEGVDLGQIVAAWYADQLKFGLNAERKGGLAVWHRVDEGNDKTKETDLLGVVEKKPLPAGAQKVVSTVGTINRLAYNHPAYMPNARNNKHGVQLKHTFIEHYGRVNFHSRTHRDSHIYIFPFWVGELLKANEKLSSLKEDLIPLWAKAQWDKRTARKMQFDEILSAAESKRTEDTDISASIQAAKIDVESMSASKPSRLGTGFSNKAWSRLGQQQSANSGTVSPGSNNDSPSHSPTRESSRSRDRDFRPPARPLPTITAIVATPTSTAYIRRVDTTQLYLAANLQLAKSDPALVPTGPPNQPDPRKVDPSCTISGTVTSADSLIGANSTVEQRAVVKRCVLGSNVTVARGARILASVVMDGVRVGENAKLDGCIVGKGAVIGKGCSLKDCEIAAGYVVEDGTDAKGEKMMDVLVEDDNEFRDLYTNVEEESSGDDDDDEDDDDEDDDEEGEVSGEDDGLFAR